MINLFILNLCSSPQKYQAEVCSNLKKVPETAEIICIEDLLNESFISNNFSTNDCEMETEINKIRFVAVVNTRYC